MAQNESEQLFPSARRDSAIVSGISNLAKAQGAEGINLEDLPVGAILEVATGHRGYRLENLGDGKVLISGHPKYCPQPVVAAILGSISASGDLKWRFLGKGLSMLFQPAEHEPIRTSPVTSVSQEKTASQASN